MSDNRLHCARVLRMRSGAWLGLVATVAVGCGGSLPLPETGPHVGDEPVEVPYPPPAAKVEVIPERKLAGTIWVDGQWMWSSRRWEWQGGQWQLPADQSYYAPPATVRLADGRLVWFRGVWQPITGSSAAK